MAYLVLSEQKEIQALFEQLLRDVHLIYFTDRDSAPYLHGKPCETCRDTGRLLAEVAALSSKIHLEIHDFETENDLAKQHGIERIPAFVIASEVVKGKLRFFGMPSGHEFSTLLYGLLDASRGETDLEARTKESIATIDKDVHIQVFVTPTCQYCAPVARLAHQVAVENPRVTADVVAINEFEDLAQRYVIRGVPKTVINDRVEFIGSVHQQQFLEHLQRAI